MDRSMSVLLLILVLLLGFCSGCRRVMSAWKNSFGVLGAPSDTFGKNYPYSYGYDYTDERGTLHRVRPRNVGHGR